MREFDFEPLITHEIPFDEAAKAYDLVDNHTDQIIQVMLRY